MNVTIKANGVDYGHNYFDGRMYADAYYTLFDTLGEHAYGEITDRVAFLVCIGETRGTFTTFEGHKVEFSTAPEEPEQVADPLATRAPF